MTSATMPKVNATPRELLYRSFRITTIIVAMLCAAWAYVTFSSLWYEQRVGDMALEVAEANNRLKNSDESHGVFRGFEKHTPRKLDQMFADALRAHASASGVESVFRFREVGQNALVEHPFGNSGSVVRIYVTQRTFGLNWLGFEFPDLDEKACMILAKSIGPFSERLTVNTMLVKDGYDWRPGNRWDHRNAVSACTTGNLNIVNALLH